MSNLITFGKHQAQVAKRIINSTLSHPDVAYLAVVASNQDVTNNMISEMTGFGISSVQDRTNRLRTRKLIQSSNRSFYQRGSNPQYLKLTSEGRKAISYILEGKSHE